MKQIRFTKENDLLVWNVGETINVDEYDFVEVTTRATIYDGEELIVGKGKWVGYHQIRIRAKLLIDNGYAEYVVEEKKRGELWKPKQGDHYFFIDSLGIEYSQSDFGEYNAEDWNFFETNQEAIDTNDWIRAARKIQAYVDECNENANGDLYWYIGFEDGELRINGCYRRISPFMFKNDDDAKQSIKDLPEEWRIFLRVK